MAQALVAEEVAASEEAATCSVEEIESTVAKEDADPNPLEEVATDLEAVKKEATKEVKTGVEKTLAKRYKRELDDNVTCKGVKLDDDARKVRTDFLKKYRATLPSRYQTALTQIIDKALETIDKTTKDTKEDTTEIKATTKDIQIKTDQLLDEQKALPEKLFEAIDKKNKAVYGKPRDQVDMALHLASQQVTVKVLNGILSDCGTKMKGSKMDKAKWIADKAKEKPEEITALLEKHATSESPAKRQRRVSDWARGDKG